MKIPLNLSDIQESRPVSNGRYNLIVASAEETKSKNGAPQIKCSIAIEGHDTAPNVVHYISLPDGSDPAKDNFKGLLLKRFLSAFDIPFDDEGFDIDLFTGATASCELVLSEPDDHGNVYNRLQLPRLHSEGGITGTLTKAKPPKR